MKMIKSVLGSSTTSTSVSTNNNKEEEEENDALLLNDDDDNKQSLPVDEETLMKLLEGDYDPEKFEQIMSQAYGDEFYNKQDEEWKTDQDVKDGLKKGAYDDDVENVDDTIYEDTYDEENYEEEEEEAYAPD
eukprot:4318103-Ditylum_brightwellii.AAC.1